MQHENDGGVKRFCYSGMLLIGGRYEAQTRACNARASCVLASGSVKAARGTRADSHV